MNPSDILADARGILDETIALRRRIHRHPEIGLVYGDADFVDDASSMRQQTGSLPVNT